MDPLTQGLATLNTLLEFAIKVYDATPQPLKEQGAGDWAKIIHNIAAGILTLQGKIASIGK